VAVGLPVTRALREVEEAHPRVVGMAPDDLPRRLLDAVPDDEELHGRALLVERARERVREERDVTVGRDEDRRVDHAGS